MCNSYIFSINLLNYRKMKQKKGIIVISIVITMIAALIVVCIGYKKGIYLFSIEHMF